METEKNKIEISKTKKNTKMLSSREAYHKYSVIREKFTSRLFFSF